MNICAKLKITRLDTLSEMNNKRVDKIAYVSAIDSNDEDACTKVQEFIQFTLI